MGRLAPKDPSGVFAAIPGPRRLIRDSLSAVAFVALAASGVVVLILFAGRLLMMHRLDTVSLPFLAVVAAAAATFNPCALPTLPAFFTLGAGAGAERWPNRARLALAISLGAMSVVVVFGIVVAWLGMEAQMLVAVHFGWVQIGGGLLLVGLALVHLLGLAGRLPLMGRITALGGRLWDRALARPNGVGAFLFGAGFVAVGGT
jgi:cytochrome c biogenesis protein CcdA